MKLCIKKFILKFRQNLTLDRIESIIGKNFKSFWVVFVRIME